MSLAATYVQYSTIHVQLQTVHAGFFFFKNVMLKSECFINISQKEFGKNGCNKLKCELRINVYRNVNLKPQNFVIYKKKKISK